MPEVLPLMTIKNWLNQMASIKHNRLRLMMAPCRGRKLHQFDQPMGPIELLVGPEGGLSPEEESTAIAAGFQSLTLGPRILRTETAALAAIAAMQMLWGDYA